MSVITLHSMIIALASFCDAMCTNHENNSTMNFEIYYVLFVMGYEKTLNIFEYIHFLPLDLLTILFSKFTKFYSL